MSYKYLKNESENSISNPYIGLRVLVRTFSEDVHIGTLKSANCGECELTEALRLWKWEDGGLSLSAVATNGINKGRLNYCPKIYLTTAIEFIPITEHADKSFQKFVEDKECETIILMKFV